MRARIALFAAAVAAFGCTTRNPAFCDNDTACDNGLPCMTLTNTCPIECVVSEDCADPGEPICAGDTTCRGCEDNSECEALDPAFPVCQAGECTGCVDSDDCTSAQAPECDTGAGSCTGCSSNELCESKFEDETLCDFDSGRCVECLTNAECTDPSAPVCADGACRGCQENTECDENVCLDDGTCAAVEDMIRVDADDPNAQPVPCGHLMSGSVLEPPCQNVLQAQTRAFQVGVGIIRLAPADYEVKFSVDGATVPLRIVGQRDGGNAVYKPTLGSPTDTLIELSDGAQLILDDVDVVDDTDSPQSTGISCLSTSETVRVIRSSITGTATGIRAESCGSLVVQRSTFRDNFAHAIRVEDTSTVITNNVIADNGSRAAGLGAIFLDQGATFSTELSFNTIVSNTAADGNPPGGVSCRSDGTIEAHSNIIFGNLVGLDSGALEHQVSDDPSCVHSFSAIEGAEDENDNISDDPLLDGQLHLMPNSPCLDAADPDATEAIDIDGEVRPQGAARDIGADEAG